MPRIASVAALASLAVAAASLTACGAGPEQSVDAGASTATTVTSSAAEELGVPWQGVADPIVYLLVPTEIALLHDRGDLATFSAKRYVHYQRLALRACLEGRGVAPREVGLIVEQKVSRVTEPPSGLLTREYAAAHGFGVTAPVLEPDGEQLPTQLPVGAAGEERARLNSIVSDCENAALQEVADRDVQSGAMETLGRYLDQLQAPAPDSTEAVDPAWRGCMQARRYEGRNVSEVIESLGLGELPGRAASETERAAAVAAHDCSGGEAGLRRQLQVRVDAATRVARTVPADQVEILMTLLR